MCKTWIIASCSPLLPVFMLSKAFHLLAVASYLTYKHEVGIDLLASLFARKVTWHIFQYVELSLYSFLCLMRFLPIFILYF